ncbi:hypothetical protein TcWFU_002423 [Taenia crassiceps]|uniref:Uncharacterized protein n=1 Tax=Taenia crassiceps TaxID=6207 RepID=A0ABR4QGC9_9CEST
MGVERKLEVLPLASCKRFSNLLSPTTKFAVEVLLECLDRVTVPKVLWKSTGWLYGERARQKINSFPWVEGGSWDSACKNGKLLGGNDRRKRRKIIPIYPLSRTQASDTGQH